MESYKSRVSEAQHNKIWDLGGLNKLKIYDQEVMKLFYPRSLMHDRIY